MQAILERRELVPLIETGRYVAKGLDSRVIQSGDTVLKVYDRRGGLPLQKVVAYHNVTNQAAALLHSTPSTFDFSIDGSVFTCRWSVTPTLGVYTDETETPVAISGYVPGPRLFSLGSIRTDPDKEWRSQYEEREVSFFDILHKSLVNGALGVDDRARRMKHFFDGQISRVSGSLNEQMICKGIKIVATNVKVRSAINGQVDFIVTDLSASIREFESLIEN